MEFVFSFVPYEFYKKISKSALLIIILLLIFTFLFAPKIKGAARWVNLGFIRFQPSELAKLFLIIHLSTLIERKGENIKNFKYGFIYFLFWIFLIAALVIIQPNVSNSMIILLVSFIMLLLEEQGLNIFLLL